jgi:hypothetical protein
VPSLPGVTNNEQHLDVQAGGNEETSTMGPKLDSNVQLNLENLTKIDEKL